MQALAKNGLRYPIPPYGVQNDVRAGLGASYPGRQVTQLPEPAASPHVHVHVFDTTNPVAERRTRQVMWLTATMMVVEIVAGPRSTRWRCSRTAGT